MGSLALSDLASEDCEALSCAAFTLVSVPALPAIRELLLILAARHVDDLDHDAVGALSRTM
jgi:hypothetical protein